MKTFNVNRERDWGAVITSFASGEPVEVFRKDPTPPFATISAPDLSSALTLARLRYGRDVVVSMVGPLETRTSP